MTSFSIEHRCPQCGAPALLEESDRLFQCPYCRVTSYLIQRDVSRFMFSHNAPESHDIVYVPYWRFKGVLFSSVPGGIRDRFMDVSYLGVRSNLFPISLGLRSQALKLKFAVPETPGRFLKPTFPVEDVMSIFQRRFSKDLPRPVYHQDYIGENLSVIYSPFYMKDRVFDAILNKPVSGPLPEEFDPARFDVSAPRWRFLFVAAICPACGWDLDGRRDSLALACRNCKTIWIPRQGRLQKIGYSTLAVPGEVYLPFWRIEASAEGVDLNSYADLIKIANLPKAPSPEHDAIPFYFWSLAFKVPPTSFVRLNRNITLAQPPDDHLEGLPDGRIYPVNLPATEAVESTMINLADFARPAEKYLPLLQSIRIKARKVRLVYIPFAEGQHEFIQEKYGLTINKNQLKYASNL